MKVLFFLISVITLVGCHSSKVAVIPQRKYNSVVVTSSKYKPREYYDSLKIRAEELELYEFLKNQPKEILEDFKRDFVLMPDQYKRFIDSIKVIK